jgi:AraC family transcriptional regulator
MIQHRLIERPAFEVLDKKTWISGQDNSLFGRFWESCQAEGLFDLFNQISAMQPGAQTNGVTLGVSRVEADPTRREFFYMIAIEKPQAVPQSASASDLESYRVPASLWAVFECPGKIPDALVASEIYAFTDWLPASEYIHASAPEMEVYPPSGNGDEAYCEFWLPITRKA